MAEFSLKARSIFDAVDGCRVEAPGLVFDEAPARSLVSLAARRGREDDLIAAAKAGFGLTLPGPARFVEASGVRALFAGPGQWLLSAAAPDLFARALDVAADFGAATDQSDGYAALTLAGPRSRDCLARLSQLDFDDAAFPTGAVARTPMQQISVTIARVGDGPDYALETPRSTARGFAHDVEVAVNALEARAAF